MKRIALLVKIMEIIKSNRNNLASILMGKNIQFPWRGQKDLVILVPFEEWKAFVSQYGGILQYRKPLNYMKLLQSQDEGMFYRYFMFDVAWALYSELACSSNTGADATLIFPHFDTGQIVQIQDYLNLVLAMDTESIEKSHSSLKSATRNYYTLIGTDDLQFGLVDNENLSTWNNLIFRICLYLQSQSSNKVKENRLNVDWRIS